MGSPPRKKSRHQRTAQTQPGEGREKRGGVVGGVGIISGKMIFYETLS